MEKKINVGNQQNQSDTKNNLVHSLKHGNLDSDRNLYDDLPIGIYRLTTSGQIIMANSTLVKMLGYNSFEELTSYTSEKEIYAKGFSRSDFLEKIEIENEVKGYESSWLRKDNKAIWVRENSKVIKDENGKPLYFEGTVEDITIQKNAEENLKNERLLFIGGPVIIIKWKINDSIQSQNNYNQNLSVEYVSPNVTQVLGFTQKELTDNMIHFYSLIHPDDVERIPKETQGFVENGQAWYQQEYRLKNKDGKYKWYFDFTRIIRDNDGTLLNYHGYLFDISARKEAEEALLKSEKQLRDLNNMKDKFFSVIAHDLRSPFQGLLGMASILVDEEFELSNSERSDFTKKLYEGLKNQFTLLDNLLTWSRLQRGVIEFVPSLNDLSGDIDEACAVLSNSYEEKNIKIISELPKSMPAYYDKNMIATVIRNLLSNAIKFTQPMGTITINASERKDDYLIMIKDTGVGIEPENILKLFRIDSLYSMRGTNDEGGTGLGLILCKEFIEKHSGLIWVDSTFGEGSTFSFTISKAKDIN
jgi:PAS domain S-box-containing protein